MIDPEMRNAVFRLHQEGLSLREISRRLHLSRNAVRAIVRQQGKVVRKEREDKIQIDPELLERLYRECDGWLQRVHEKLVEEHGIQVGYPLPADGVRGQYYSPPGQTATTPSAQEPPPRRPAGGTTVAGNGNRRGRLLDFALSACGVQRHRLTVGFPCVARPASPCVRGGARLPRYLRVRRRDHPTAPRLV